MFDKHTKLKHIRDFHKNKRELIKELRVMAISIPLLTLSIFAILYLFLYFVDEIKKSL